MRGKVIGWVVLLSLLLTAQAAMGTPPKDPLWIDAFGGWDEFMYYWPLRDNNFDILENGDLVMAVWAGRDGALDPPVMALGSPFNGQPTGDDVELPVEAGEILWWTFHANITTWQIGDLDSLQNQRHPVKWEKICVRVFNDSNLVDATYYGESELYTVKHEFGEKWFCQLPNDPDGPTTDTGIFGKFFKVIGGINPYTLQTFKLKDKDGVELEDGDLVQLIWVGPDGEIDPPDGVSRMPGDDDELADTWGVNEGMWPQDNTGVFKRFTASFDSISHGIPVKDEKAYVRVWNSDNILGATYYGDSDLYTVLYEIGESLSVFYDDAVDCDKDPPPPVGRDLTIHGGYNPDNESYWPLQDIYGLRLLDGDLVQLIWAGPDATIDGLDEYTGLPTGDDSLLAHWGIGEGMGMGTGRFKYGPPDIYTYEHHSDGYPAKEDVIYLRVFDDSTIGVDSGALWYGESETYQVQWELNEEFLSFADEAYDATNRVPWYKTLTIYGGLDTAMVEHALTDSMGVVLEDGNLVQLIWAGPDSAIASIDTLTGLPTGDDSLLTTWGVGNAVDPGLGLFKKIVQTFSGHKGNYPAQGDFVYLRVFNHADIFSATHYGQSELHKVSYEADEEFFSFPDDDDDTIYPNPAETTAVEWTIPTASLPTEYALFQNYPNPFNPETDIQYQIPEAGPVELTIYNVLGQEVYVLIDGHRDAGKYTVRWCGTDSNGRALSSGIYFYRLRAGEFVSVRKMVLLK